jgi:hypothetical protein
VIFRFDLRRVLRQKLGRFFGFGYLLILLWLVSWLWLSHLAHSSPLFTYLIQLID